MSDSQQIKVSVVIPVYNAADYLEEMIDSLIAQTLKEIEILCVDDGSVDDSIRILEKYREKDDRIHIYQNKHLGAAAARNFGLSKASGEYILFLDADDFFDLSLLMKVHNKGTKTGADVVLFGGKKYNNRTGELQNAPRYLWRKLLPTQEVFSRKDMDGNLFCLTTPAPWSKAFRREFLLRENITFQNLSNSNDVRFVLTALGVAERITAIPEDLVFYRVSREGSLQSQKHRDPLCFLAAYAAAYDELNQRGVYPDVEKGFASMVLSGCVYNLKSIRGEEARWKVIRALCSEQFTRMNLLDYPEDYYDILEYRDQIKGLTHALRVKEAFESGWYDKKNPVGRKDEKNESGKKIKVSVIISIYNTERYLSACLDSICQQTLKEIEIICINDGSTDHSGEILKKYAAKDERILICEQDNAGLSAARNQGLFLSRGEYVYFMDSDDILDIEALSELYCRSKEENLDVLFFNGRTFFDNETIKEEHPEFEDYYIRENRFPKCTVGQEMFRQMRKYKEYRTSVCIQFFRRQYLLDHKLTFIPGILHEDNAFSFQAILLAERVGYTEKKYFNRRVRENSIMTGGITFAHVYGYFRCYLCMEEFVRSHEFSEETGEELFQTLNGIKNSTRAKYNRLQNEEKYAFWGLPCAERVLFRVLVESEVRQEKKKVKRLKKELNRLKVSRSYRLARVIGAPMRMMRKMRRNP